MLIHPYLLPLQHEGYIYYNCSGRRLAPQRGNKELRQAVIREGAFCEGFVQTRKPERNGKHVAVIGAGPAGLAAANALNQMGFTVTVFEKNEAAGGLLRYGIPNFKLNKTIIDRVPINMDGSCY